MDLRNILIHGYAKVNDRIIWNTAHSDLPRMANELDAVLRELDC
ncbi:HepT-like ribonuclease domain-containing protein [Arhodomonas sp. SL1]